MDASVPRGAALLLDFLAVHESRGDYAAVFGDHKLATPVTAMTIDHLIAAQKVWGKAWGSSAAGRYQFMPATLTGLKKAMGLTGRELFTPDFQDRLAYQLLKQRGYQKFVARQITGTEFGLQLAEEWASLPVLASTKGAHRVVARGETYYAGDKLNRALVSPADVEAALAQVLAALQGAKSVIPAPPAAKPVSPAVPAAPAAKPVNPPSLLQRLENFILSALARH